MDMTWAMTATQLSVQKSNRSFTFCNICRTWDKNERERPTKASIDYMTDFDRVYDLITEKYKAIMENQVLHLHVMVKKGGWQNVQNGPTWKLYLDFAKIELNLYFIVLNNFVK